MRYLIPLFSILIIVSCKSEKKLTDDELMEQSARSYFFMGDSVDVEVTILDTIFTDELTETLDMIDANISLVQQDIDTLNLMMDELAYDADNPPVLQTKTDHQVCCEASEKKEKMLGFQIKMKELNLKKLTFKNSSRIFLHLKRSIWANISGYEANVHYQLNDEVADIKVLMDADFNVVD